MKTLCIILVLIGVAGGAFAAFSTRQNPFVIVHISILSIGSILSGFWGMCLTKEVKL